MKKLLSFTIVLLIAISIHGQAPQKMSYQCVIRNSAGNLVTNQAVGLKISIRQGSASGTVIFSETYSPAPQSNANGLVTIEIGSGTASTGNFADIDWSTGSYFLETQTDPTGGTNYTISGTSQLLSVPYALYAKSAANGFSGNYNDLTNTPLLFSGSYNDLTNRPTLFDGTWTTLTGKPTTLSGYGIIDAMSTTHAANAITTTNITNWTSAFGWGNHAGLYRPVTYVPSWSEVTAKPTTVTGYGITDAVTTMGNQTISGIKTFTNGILGAVNANNNKLTNLTNPSDPQDAATKSYVDELIAKIRSIQAGGFITDLDGNVYNAIKIGNQTWMAENLKTTKYYDGTNIILAADNTAWSNNTTGAYSWFGNNEATYKNMYGALYNWYAIGTGKLCPTGWHVPTLPEWNILQEYMIANGYNYDGSIVENKIGKALASESLWWLSPYAGAVGNTDYPKYRNLSGFNGVPAGGRTGSSGSFDVAGGMAYWWTSMDDGSPNSIAKRLDYNHQPLIEGGHPKSNGYSIRCIKD